MTKPIILVKICYQLSHVIQISDFLASADIKDFGCIYVPIYKAASYWPHTFMPGVFLFSMYYN